MLDHSYDWLIWALRQVNKLNSAATREQGSGARGAGGARVIVNTPTVMDFNSMGMSMTKKKG